MTVLIAWIVAVVIAALILGIVGFDLLGRVRRLRRAAASIRVLRDQAQVVLDSVQRETSAGRHSTNTR